MNNELEQLIEEQIEYYRKRAPEYDATDIQEDDPLYQHALPIQAALDRFAPTGRVLEIACGTGSGTRHLLKHATSITALDSSPESIELSRAKLGNDPKVTYVQADVFTWEPDGLYDTVFFSYWISHVPPERFEAFWDKVGRALAPGGRVFFVDEAEDAWRNEALLHEVFEGDSSTIVKRPLQDGRTYRVVKVFWDPKELERRLADLGWDIITHMSGPFFWAEGGRV